MYPAIENACRHMEQYINNKIESGQNVLHSKDVCAVVLDPVFSLELLFTYPLHSRSPVHITIEFVPKY